MALNKDLENKVADLLLYNCSFYHHIYNPHTSFHFCDHLTLTQLDESHKGSADKEAEREQVQEKKPQCGENHKPLSSVSQTQISERSHVPKQLINKFQFK